MDNDNDNTDKPTTLRADTRIKTILRGRVAAEYRRRMRVAPRNWQQGFEFLVTLAEERLDELDRQRQEGRDGTSREDSRNG